MDKLFPTGIAVVLMFLVLISLGVITEKSDRIVLSPACVDYDANAEFPEGHNIYVPSYAEDSANRIDDQCYVIVGATWTPVDSCTSAEDCRMEEAACRTSDEVGIHSPDGEGIVCEDGCVNGACLCGIEICESFETCENGWCVPEVDCVSQSDCSIGDYCALEIGKCIPSGTCDDTDNGIDYFVQGGCMDWLNLNGFRDPPQDHALDWCYDGTLREWYCEGDNDLCVYEEYDECTQGCAAGACVTECFSNNDCNAGEQCAIYPGVTGKVCVANDFCEDEDGQNKYVKGKAIALTLPGQVREYEDYCTDADTVGEYSCTSYGALQNNGIDCENGCSDGECDCDGVYCSDTGKVCDTSDLTCVECLSNSDCDSAKRGPYCDVNNKCQPCLHDGHCLIGQTCYPDLTGNNHCGGEVVECTDDSHCSTGEICEANSCVVGQRGYKSITYSCEDGYSGSANYEDCYYYRSLKSFATNFCVNSAHGDLESYVLYDECVLTGTIVDPCEETGDVGKDYFTQGTNKIGTDEFQDGCLYDDFPFPDFENILIELSCDAGGDLNFDWYNCVAGCVDGVCNVPPECSSDDDCPEGSACDLTNEVCVACTDSDQGQNFEVKGDIIGVNNLGEYLETSDTCTGGDVLLEYYCDDEAKVATVPRDCKEDDKNCFEGRCVETTPGHRNANWQCKDDSTGESENDECKYNYTLMSFAVNDCGFDDVDWSEFDLVSPCTLTGEIQKTCKESRDSKEYNKRGSVELGKFDETDNCKNSTTLIEYWCENSTIANWEEVFCDFGCRYGKCSSIINPDDCDSDSDCSDEEYCVSGDCVECRLDSHCLDDEECEENSCVPVSAECESDDDCNRFEPYCVADECVECERDSHCDSDEECSAGRCVEDFECNDNEDCDEGEICNDEGDCVEQDNTGLYVFLVILVLLIIVSSFIVFIVVKKNRKVSSSLKRGKFPNPRRQVYRPAPRRF